AIVLLISAFLGEYILQFFGISIAAFQVAGGMVLMLLAFNMLQAKSSRYRHTPEEAAEGMQKEDVAVVPLAIPLLAGPGTMITVIIAHHKSSSWLSSGLLVLDILAIAGVAYVALRLAGPLSRRLGVTGINISTRIFGLVLASIAVTFIANGLSALFPALAHGFIAQSS
ncbi:amino acid transporter, partial [Acidithiobacillus caldus]